MISNQKKKFSLSGNSIYLNGAYMSPLLKEVEKAGMEGIKRKRNPGNLSAEDFFTGTPKLRDEFAKLINTKEVSRIVTVPSVSYGL
ncbi:MAG TPA: aminotransferase, partial [Cyclobacteriaceae bacterium]|nr:aminotransferase [Cyclobacteriaceae bacterium]